jgi:hypothetical protein
MPRRGARRRGESGVSVTDLDDFCRDFLPHPDPLPNGERVYHFRVLKGRLLLRPMNSTERVLSIGEIWGVDFLV